MRDQPFAPRIVAPDPFGEAVFDLLLLFPRRLRGSGVYDGIPFGIAVVDRGRAEIQRVLDQFVGGNPIRAPLGEIGGVAAVKRVHLHGPKPQLLHVTDLHGAGIALTGLHDRADKIRDVRRRNPDCAQPGIDFVGREIVRLHRPQCLGVRLVARIVLRHQFGERQLFAHIAGEVFVLRLPAPGGGIEEDEPAQLRQKLLHGAADQLCNVIEVDPAAFVQGNDQRLTRTRDLLDRTTPFNGPLPKDRGLGRGLIVRVVVLQRKEQGQIRIAGKGPHVRGS